MLSRGLQELELLFPGYTAQLIDAGAVLVDCVSEFIQVQALGLLYLGQRWSSVALTLHYQWLHNSNKNNHTACQPRLGAFVASLSSPSRLALSGLTGREIGRW